jgi:hypothetical protein
VSSGLGFAALLENAGNRGLRYLFYNGEMKSSLIVLTNRDNYLQSGLSDHLNENERLSL